MESFYPFEVRRYYETQVPDLRLSHLREWRGPCPIHKGKRWSFAVNADTGLWRCFSKCGCGGDIIGLERVLAGADFVTARKNVYDIIGREVPAGVYPSRTHGQRRRFARRRASARNLAESARRWHRATVAALQHRKDTAAAFSAAWVSSCRSLTIWEALSPREILEAYIRVARDEPEATARSVKWAEEVERECAQITAAAVRLIAAAEKTRNAA